jgi:hypothetical protein
MKINTNSWHYKVVYETCCFCGDMPETLCGYLFRLLIVPLIALPMLIVLLFMVACMYVLMGLWAIVCVSLGYYPTKDFWLLNEDSEQCNHYDGLSIGSFQLYPWHVLVVALPAVITVMFYHWWGMTAMWWVSGVVVGVLLFVALFFFIVSDTCDSMREWLFVKKQKVCPQITYEDKK